jgi:hypothetical protein
MIPDHQAFRHLYNTVTNSLKEILFLLFTEILPSRLGDDTRNTEHKLLPRGNCKAFLSLIH